MLWGLCGNLERGSWPSAPEQRLLGVQVLRTLVYDLDAFDAAMLAVPSPVPVIALLNQETAGVASPEDPLVGWPAVCGDFLQRWAGRGRILAVEVLNEWDTQLPVEKAVWAVQQALALQAQIRGAPRILVGSVAGDDWVQALTDACHLLGADLRRCLGVAMHPYGQRADGYPDGWGFGELASAIETVYGIADRPVCLTEYGINLANVDGDQEAQAQYLARARQRVFSHYKPHQLLLACKFCWRDDTGVMESGERFGDRLDAGEPRLSWAVHAALGGTL